MDEHGSGSCETVGFGICGVDPLGPAAREVANWCDGS
jgi:hypothetical protein